jgi:hypothetical protein
MLPHSKTYLMAPLTLVLTGLALISTATVLPWNIGVYSQTGPVLKLGTNMRFESVGFNLMFMQIPCA